MVLISENIAPPRHKCSNLVHVAVSGQGQDNFLSDFTELLNNMANVVGFHLHEIEAFHIRVGRASPRRAGKDYQLVSLALEPFLDFGEAIARDPFDPVLHAVDARIVSGTFHDLRLFLNGIDLWPAARVREGNGTAACSAERVDQDGLAMVAIFL